MPKLQDLQQELATLQAERTRISTEGEVLLDCWVAQSAAGGTARTGNLYWQVRSRHPIFDGKKSRYLKVSEVAEYEAAIACGKRIKALDKEIEKLQQRISKLEALLDAV
jgi:polyhydroxyalkanoate synthesis regulator phasin